jgi:hypothetical protein
MSFPFRRGNRGRGRGRGSSSPSTPPIDHQTNSPQYYIGSSSQPLPFPSAPYTQSNPDTPIDNPSSSSQRVPATQEQERTLRLPDGKGSDYKLIVMFCCESACMINLNFFFSLVYTASFHRLNPSMRLWTYLRAILNTRTRVGRKCR